MFGTKNVVEELVDVVEEQEEEVRPGQEEEEEALESVV